MTDLLCEALVHAEGIVRAVPGERLSAPTTCDWDVSGLMNHMVGGNRYFAAAARGEEPDRGLFSGDHTGGDAPAAYHRSADEAVRAWSRPGVLDETLPSGPPGRFLWGIHLVEVLAHGWDLALATGQQRDIPDHLVEAALDIARGMPADQIRSPAVFGPEIEPAPGASPADRLAAFLGRPAPSGTPSA